MKNKIFGIKQNTLLAIIGITVSVFGIFITVRIYVAQKNDRYSSQTVKKINTNNNIVNGVTIRDNFGIINLNTNNSVNTSVDDQTISLPKSKEVKLNIQNVSSAIFYSKSSKCSNSINVRNVLDRLINEKHVDKIYISCKPFNEDNTVNGLGVQDPCPGEKKVLCIEYDSHEGRIKKEIEENDYIVIIY